MTEEFMTKKDKYYSMITALVISFWLVFSYWLIYVPSHTKLQQLRADVSANEQQLMSIKQFIDQYDSIDEFEEKVSKENTFWENKLPDNKNETEFISLLQETAYKNNTKVMSIEPADDIKKINDVQASLIRIKLQCDYFQLLAFLRDLDMLSRYNVVERVNIAKKNNILESDLLIKIFYLNKL